ncbi:MAG: hypothetical protein ACTS9Y_02600 [Methylophilus sp.]|uniref:hypothetical protein n=1 Tax=Methylophilus sp. TaxID=29541 RepID=UPI003F9EE7AC
MKQLKYDSDAFWARLPMLDFRPRFFVETFIEKLSTHTPHFYQSRLLNLFSTCEEMLEHLEAFQRNEKNSGYILSSMDEISECWNFDPVAQELLGEFALIIKELPKILKSSEISYNTQIKIKTFCRAILSRREAYLTSLLKQLEDSIVAPADISQKDRLTGQIDRLTGLYITYLLNQGYSPTYLFNRSDMFTRENNYGGRSFEDQFRYVTGRLTNRELSFEVYFGFHTARPNLLTSINDEPDLQFIRTIPQEIRNENLEKFKKNIAINVVAKHSIVSTDYVTAALRTKERLDRLLDTEMVMDYGNELQISSHCVIILSRPQPIVKTLNLDLLLAFMSSNSGSSNSHTNISIRKVLKNLDDPAKEQFSRSLRYLRLARHSVSLEQKLMNLWIALESLFGNEGNNIIGNILEFVPQFYAIAGLIRRVNYLRNLLSKNKIPITPLAASDIGTGITNFDSSITNANIFALLRNEPAAMELFASLGNKEHLKFKLIKIFQELKDNKSISKRLSKSEEDVTRQLRRIYFLRNKIAHAGHFQGVRPQLITHLNDYVYISYNAIATAAQNAKDGQLYSISELLASSKMGVDLLTSRVSSKEEVSSLDHITLQAVI